MHTLHTRAAQIYQWWASESGEQPVSDEEKNACTSSVHLGPSLWVRGWCPLLQGIARLCCDSRKQVRATAITYLQRSLLVHDLQSLTASEWESCFNTVLFPLLAKLLEPQRSTASTKAQLQLEHSSWEETRIRAATLLSKVFLQHLVPLQQLPTFTALWLTLLDFMDKYMHLEQNESIAENIPEMLKNMLLVMETAGVFGSTTESDSKTATSPQTLHMKTQLWNMTCDRIDVFLPGLRQEVSRSKTPVVRVLASTVTVDSALAATSDTEVSESSPQESQQNSLEPAPEQPSPEPEIVITKEVISVEPEVDHQQTIATPVTTIDEAQADVSDETHNAPIVATDPVNQQAPDLNSARPNFVPQSVFSVWNVPDPADASAFFFHDLSPAPDAQLATSEPPKVDDKPSDVPILPISLIPNDDSAVPVVPLPVFTAPIENNSDLIGQRHQV